MYKPNKLNHASVVDPSRPAAKDYAGPVFHPKLAATQTDDAVQMENDPATMIDVSVATVIDAKSLLDGDQELIREMI